MQSIFHPTQHTSARIYLYDSQFTKREALHDPDSIEVTNLNTMGLLDFDLSGLKNQRIQGGRLELKMLTPDYPHEVAITTIQDSWDWRFANNFTARENTPWGGNKWLSDVIMSTAALCTAGFPPYMIRILPSSPWRFRRRFCRLWLGGSVVVWD